VTSHPEIRYRAAGAMPGAARVFVDLRAALTR